LGVIYFQIYGYLL